MTRSDSISRLVLLAAAVSLLVVGSAKAEGYYVQAHGGFTTVILDDVNDAVDAFNQAAGDDYLDHIGTGWEAGLTLGFDITRNLGLGLGYARLWASSKYSEGSSQVTFDMPADLYEITLDYLPASDQQVRFGAGMDLGVIRSAASFQVSDPMIDEHHQENYDGTGFLFAGYAIVDASLSGKWTLYGEGGFRHALINKVKVEGETVYNPDSLDDQLRFNYSGVFLRVGVKFRL